MKTRNVVQVSVKNVIWGEFALAIWCLAHPQSLSLTPLKAVRCPSLVNHVPQDILNILQHHHWSCGTVIFCYIPRLSHATVRPEGQARWFCYSPHLQSKNHAWPSESATSLHKQWGFFLINGISIEKCIYPVSNPYCNTVVPFFKSALCSRHCGIIWHFRFHISTQESWVFMQTGWISW